MALKELIKFASFALTALLTTTDSFGAGPLGNQEKYNQEIQKDCEKTLKGLPADYRRGKLQVPEDYSQPNGKKIEVFWYTRLQEGQTPVVWINGGPSFSNSGNWVANGEREKRLNIGFIYMDQRGTGCSDPYPVIVDAETAKRNALYSSENIARDHEELRKLLLGKDGKWKMVGQSYGGYVLERYLQLFPENLIAGYNFAGVPKASNIDNTAMMLMSQAYARKKLFEIFPGTEESFKKLVSRVKNESCVKIGDQGGLCGLGVLASIERSHLVDEMAYEKYSKLIKYEADCQIEDQCLLNSDGSFNQKYFDEKAYVADVIKLTWWGGGRGPLNLPSLLRQDMAFESLTEPSYKTLCIKAKALLKKKGYDLNRDLPVNECQILEQVYSQYSGYDLHSIFSRVPVKNLVSDIKLAKSMIKNPQLKYFIYSGDLDGMFRNTNQDINGKPRKLPANQVINRHFTNRGHFFFTAEPIVWEDISGLPFKKFSTVSLEITSGGLSTMIENVGNLNGSRLRSDADDVSGQALYVGLANDPLDPVTAAELKGKVAIIDRGGKKFIEKIQHVLAAGAIGAIVVNNVLFPPGEATFELFENVSIPGLSVSQSSGAVLKAMLKNDPSLIVHLRYDLNGSR